MHGDRLQIPPLNDTQHIGAPQRAAEGARNATDKLVCRNAMLGARDKLGDRADVNVD